LIENDKIKSFIKLRKHWCLSQTIA
jgi:hypothetical protein